MNRMQRVQLEDGIATREWSPTDLVECEACGKVLCSGDTKVRGEDFGGAQGCIAKTRCRPL